MEWKIIHIDETDSTNQWLKQHGDGSFCVVADYQTAGRGCGTNTWESERGQNLLFSLLIHPADIAANEQFRITEAVSVALCETLENLLKPLRPLDSSPNFGEHAISIKWPNDIYVGNKKIAGILIENRLKGNRIKDSIIGIGLNVNQREFHSDAPNPVSLCQLLGHEVDREALLHEFLYRKLSFSHAETTAVAYRNRLYLRGKPASYRDANGWFRATILDVEPDGRLVMQDEAGRERRYSFKEVVFAINQH